MEIPPPGERFVTNVELAKAIRLVIAAIRDTRHASYGAYALKAFCERLLELIEK